MLIYSSCTSDTNVKINAKPEIEISKDKKEMIFSQGQVYLHVSDNFSSLHKNSIARASLISI